MEDGSDALPEAGPNPKRIACVDRLLEAARRGDVSSRPAGVHHRQHAFQLTSQIAAGTPPMPPTPTRGPTGCAPPPVVAKPTAPQGISLTDMTTIAEILGNRERRDTRCRLLVRPPNHTDIVGLVSLDSSAQRRGGCPTTTRSYGPISESDLSHLRAS